MMHFDSSGIDALISLFEVNDAFVIDDGGTERFRIDSDGDLKFGDQSAQNNSTAVVHLDVQRVLEWHSR